MIAVIDYGVGNLRSLVCALNHIKAECMVTSDKRAIEAADKIILPGVGAFGDASLKLRSTGLDKVITAQAKNGKPLMGICLGMQLLYERGFEYGEHEGLGLIDGDIRPLTQEILGGALKIPHMGWNKLEIHVDTPLLVDVRDGDFVYYVHSYFAQVSDDTVAVSRYGDAEITGMVQRGNIFGAQFHPEKSGSAGLEILRAFAGLKQ